MPTATVTSKRQVTLPAQICKELRIGAGTRIDFVKNAAGETVLRPKSGDIRKLRGCVNGGGVATTQEAIDAAIGDAVVGDYLRSIA
jgi:antitoxin PrlF